MFVDFHIRIGTSDQGKSLCALYKSAMRQLDYPIDLVFNIGTISNDFSAYDAAGNMVAYVRQRMFKLKEHIEVFEDESKKNLIYKIQADRWLDFSASYSFYDAYGDYLGRIARQGMRSLWKASYDIMDHEDQSIYRIEEENPWIKALDGLFGDIPLVGNYIFNPTYLITAGYEEIVARLRKEPSLFGQKFTVYNKVDISPDHGEVMMLGVMMMVLLERRRG